MIPKTEYTLEKFESGMHYIKVDVKSLPDFDRKNNRRYLATLNNELEIHCAVMSRAEGGYFIIIGLSICKKLKLTEGSIIRATFTPDSSEYQCEMPEELQEVLDTDAEASAVFHSLTQGNQRGLIYLVTQVKSSEKRIERALKIADRIKCGVTSPRKVLK